ncbi:MAG: DUF4149 domain-containing protein [Lachnospiraceae bacterium]|nr:DUF4149 domain-containing protein [Lachnospiraceae bacterium]
MNPGMLLFGLIDAGVAFFLVYNLARAKFGGEKSTLARIIGSVLGTVVFIVYFGVIVWFNTDPHTVSSDVKTVVYAAPFVLTILMTALVLLSQPPKKKETDEEEEEEEKEPEEETSEPETEE